MVATDVAVRELHRGRVWRANALRLVEERGDVAALWSPRGILRKIPVDETGAEIRIPISDWVLGDRETTMDALWLVYAGRPYSLGIYWRDGVFSHWYVNLEQPLGRSRLGWDYVDHKLDLVVRPDGSVRWKDEDELAQAHAVGLLDAAAVRADAERVLAHPPWPTGWEDWHPDPAWPPPVLPAGWDVV